MVKRTCDRCGKEVVTSGGDYMSLLLFIEVPNVRTDRKSFGSREADLCSTCADAYAELVRRFMAGMA